MEIDTKGDVQEYLIVEDMEFMIRPARKHPTLDNIIVKYKCKTEEGKPRDVLLMLLMEYPGRSKEEAREWFHRRGLGMPSVARYALRMVRNAKRPEAILVEKEGEWDRVVEEHFNEGQEGIHDV